MPRQGSGKYTINGTRGGDVITIGADGFTANGQFTPLTASQIDGGIIVKANAGNDIVVGGRGPDEIDGAGGDDRLTGGAGFDKLLGGAGNDWLIDLDVLLVDDNYSDSFDPNANRGAYFDGGMGIDTVSFDGAGKGVSVHLSGGTIHTDFSVVHNGHRLVYGFDDQSGLQRITNVENIIGTGFNDFLAGDNNSNFISGGGGEDAIWGVSTGTTGDRLYGDSGWDELIGGTGNDIFGGGADGDTFVFDWTVSGGADVIVDYNQNEGDRLVFIDHAGPPTWQLVDHDGDGDLAIRFTYSTGSVIIDNVDNINMITIITSTDGLW